MADAGPGGTLSAGQTVTLGGPGTGGGPWGSNVTYEWGQLDGSDSPESTVTLSAADAARPSFMVPALASATDVKLVLVVSGKGDGSLLYAANSLAEFTIRGLAPTGLAVVSKPVDGGDTYRQGETIEVAVTFGDRVLVDTSLGTPTLTLVVGEAGPLARYVRGSGTTRLVFAHTVVANDTDSDGISALADRLIPKGGVIASVYGAPAILTHTALAAQAGHKVDGTDPHSFDTDRRHLRAHAPGARQAAGAGQGEARQQRDRELLGGDAGGASADADQCAGSAQRGHRDAQAGRFRESRRDRHPAGSTATA